MSDNRAPNRILCIATTEQASALSTRMHCGECGREVWISVTMAPLAQNGGAVPTCIPCARGIASTTDVEFALHDRQVGELAARGVLPFAEEFVERANRGERW